MESRVKLYMPREESFPIPLKSIDVTRNTYTSLDVMSEKSIDDYWNVDGDRELSDMWTGSHKIHYIECKATGWIYMVQRETHEKTNDLKARQIMARNMETCV